MKIMRMSIFIGNDTAGTDEPPKNTDNRQNTTVIAAPLRKHPHKEPHRRAANRPDAINPTAWQISAVGRSILSGSSELRHINVPAVRQIALAMIPAIVPRSEQESIFPLCAAVDAVRLLPNLDADAFLLIKNLL